MEKYIRAGCGVMVFNQYGQLLLGLRNSDPDLADSELKEEGTWTMPGGNIEYGEDFEDAAIREGLEEANIILKDLEVICIQTDKNEHAHYISVGMKTSNFDGVPTVMEPDEIVRWEWFNLDTLPNNIFSPSKKTIDCYLQNKIYIK